ncbi:beta strand repeat-containing protein [Ensifer soli]|uniref:beta strand repeat-containing protein n=1 Tax=Ciceribacter sp. sgz301302 TaxID=3342379 RepID=UPI0035BAFBAF
MTVTVTYDFDDGHEAQPLPFDFVSGKASIARLSHGGIVGIGDQFGHTEGDIFFTGSNGELAQSRFGPIISTNSAVSELSNGNIVIAGQDSDSVGFTIVNGTFGDVVTPATDFSAPDSTHADVVGLSGGGFAVGYQQAITSSNSDVVVSFFGNDGTPGMTVALDTSGARDTDVSMARLEGGNVAITWTRTIGSQTEIWYAVRSSTGGQVKAATLLDTDGTVNRNASVTATKDGGFAIAYEDNQWGADAAGITLAKVNAQGNNAVRLQVKTVSAPGHTEPDITQLDNGLFAVTVVRDGIQTFVELIDANGNELAARDILRSPDGGNDPHDPSIAPIGVGRMAVVYSDPTAGFTGGQIVNIVRHSIVDRYSSGASIVKGDDFIDDIVGGFDSDILSGGNGNDIIDGGYGADTLDGGDGDDLIVDSASGGGFDSIFGGNGSDTVDYRTAAGSVVAQMQGAAQSYIMVGGFYASEIYSVENILGGASDDSLTGDEFSNTFWGNDGADTLDGGAGADRLAGGQGNDTYVVDDADDVVSEVAAYDDDALPPDGDDTVKSGVLSVDISDTGHFAGDIENVILMGTLNLSATGNGLANTLAGNAGDNRLDGGAHADVMAGGAGNDIYVVDAIGDRIVELKNKGTDTVNASVSFSLSGQAIESLVLTGSGAIDGVGNSSANVITGNSGANRIDGGTNADQMYGKGGNDTYIVDNAGDRVFEANNAGMDTVNSAVSFSLSGQAIENLTLTGSAAINATGNSSANVITGNSGANRIDGGTQADQMHGRGGNDAYIVDNIGDRVFEAASGGTDMVNSSVAFSLAGQAIENLTLTGRAEIKATGNGLANIIKGNGVANILDGGLGADILTGGSGADTFAFASTTGSGNIDRITDFDAPSETIRLDRSFFAGLALGPLNGAAFKDLGVAGATLDASDRIVYNSKTGVLLFDGNGDGAGGSVQFATLDNKAVLTAADFLVIA